MVDTNVSSQMDDLYANVSSLIDQLRKEMQDMRNDFNENDNAFFLCSMAIIIFCLL